MEERRFRPLERLRLEMKSAVDRFSFLVLLIYTVYLYRFDVTSVFLTAENSGKMMSAPKGVLDWQ
jgi:hypothetical protein